MPTALETKLVIAPFLVSALIGLAATLPTIKLARKFGLVTDAAKDKHPSGHTHQGTVCRGGGLPVWLALVITSLIFLPPDRHLVVILIAATTMVGVGLADDKYNLNPYLRLITNLAAAAIVVFGGIRIDFITNPFSGIIGLSPLISVAFGLIWLVSLSNIVNWSKGFDGQLPGMVVMAGLTIAALALRFSADITQWPVAVLAAITAGAYLGFLPFNLYPAKIMPGYGGGSLAGFMLATLAILSTAKVGTAVVVLGVPIIDAVYAIVRRVLAGRSPVWGDRGHLHHRLLDEWHWGKREAAVFYWVVTAVLGWFALRLNPQQKLYTILMLGVVIGGLFLWFNFLRASLKPPDRSKR